MSRHLRSMVALSMAVVMALFGCDGSGGRESIAGVAQHVAKQRVYPDLDWPRGDPEDHGLSRKGLEQLAALAEQYDSSCLVVVHDGVLVGEWYWNGYGPDVDLPDALSTTKSVVSAVIGIAQAQGLIDIRAPASDYIPQWRGTASENVRVFDLMVHTSGREWSFAIDYGLGFAYDQTAYALSLGQVLPPGVYWQFANTNHQALEAVLEAAIGGDIEPYAQAKLFEPIGMTVTMNRDAAGNPLIYRGLSASCRDLARFGLLYLREGEWKGTQVVPKAWVRDSIAPSTELNAAYGLMWWLNHEGHVIEPSLPERIEYEGRFIPTAPTSIYAAFGAYAQMVVVDPEDRYVLVRLSDDVEAHDLLGKDKIEALWGAFQAAKL